MEGSRYSLEIRRYDSIFCRDIVNLFLETVHSVNQKDYSPAQLNVWAPREQDLAWWNESFLDHYALIAIKNNRVLGFGDIWPDGYLDRLYVAKDHQREGIGALLCDRLEASVTGKKLITHASITALPFFEKRGYRMVREQQVERRGILLTNFVMEKNSWSKEP